MNPRPAHTRADSVLGHRTQEASMGDKSPKKTNAKKPGKSLKDKRADKQAKRDEKRSGYGG